VLPATHITSQRSHPVRKPIRCAAPMEVVLPGFLVTMRSNMATRGTHLSIRKDDLTRQQERRRVRCTTVLGPDFQPNAAHRVLLLIEFKRKKCELTPMFREILGNGVRWRGRVAGKRLSGLAPRPGWSPCSVGRSDHQPYFSRTVLLSITPCSDWQGDRLQTNFYRFVTPVRLYSRNKIRYT
jgi:hypothetical protein